MIKNTTNLYLYNNNLIEILLKLNLYNFISLNSLVFRNQKILINMLLINKFKKYFFYFLTTIKFTKYNWCLRKYRSEWIRYFYPHNEIISEEFLYFNEFNTFGFFNTNKKKFLVKSCVSLKRVSGLLRLKFSLNTILLKKIKHLKFHQKMFNDFKMNHYLFKKNKKNFENFLTTNHKMFKNNLVDKNNKNQLDNLVNYLNGKNKLIIDLEDNLNENQTNFIDNFNNSKILKNDNEDVENLLINEFFKEDFNLYTDNENYFGNNPNSTEKKNFYSDSDSDFSDDDFYDSKKKKSFFIKNKNRIKKFLIWKKNESKIKLKFNRSKLSVFSKKPLSASFFNSKKTKKRVLGRRALWKNKRTRPLLFRNLPFLNKFFEKKFKTFNHINDKIIDKNSFFFKDPLIKSKNKKIFYDLLKQKKKNNWKRKKRRLSVYSLKEYKPLEVPKMRFKRRFKAVVLKNRQLLSFMIKKKMRNHWHFSKLIKGFIKRPFKDFFFLFDLSLSSILLRSHFIFGLDDLNFFINNNFVYVNNKVVTNKLKILNTSDKINFVFNNHYYYYYRHMLSLFKNNFSKLSDYNFMRKGKVYNFYKTRKPDHPNWVKKFIYFRRDIPNFLEVDFMTMTIILIYSPKFFFDLNRNTIKFVNHYQRHLYNWRFII